MKISQAEEDRIMKAYNDHVGRYGRNSAIDAVENGSGQMFVTEVTADQVAATLSALARPPAVVRGKAPIRLSHDGRSSSVHDKLAALAEAIYGRRSS
jgi:hypothetical protein